MPRKARLDMPGALHHIMIRGSNRTDIFIDDTDRKAFLDRLGTEVIKAEAAIYAWVLMDNHVHLLFKSGRHGISTVMRKLLTWYAQYFNRRHKRTGHLFENRYKSILCDEHTYLLPLVRYIHLNPVRAGVVKTLDQLARYRWCGYGSLVRHNSNPWMRPDDVLLLFGRNRKKAIDQLNEYMTAGLAEGKKPELTGGGLVRSKGGWSKVLAARSRKEDLMHDERILGDSEFIQGLMEEIDEREKRQLAIKQSGVTIQRIIKEECRKKGIPASELKGGGRRGITSRARAVIIKRCIRELGLSLAETARHVGVSTASVWKIINKEKR